jgi:small subunit ribosomal protein S13
MVRISGVELPRKKRIDIGLTYVFGIGKTTAWEVLNEAEVDFSKKCGGLTNGEVTRIRLVVSGRLKTQGDLRRVVSQNIRRLANVGSAKGRRHRVGLPVRGQRTRTNARTRKDRRIQNKE